MKIITRDGTLEPVRLDAITERIKKACDYCGDLSSHIDPVRVAVKVVNSIRDNITTSELDDITAKICMNWSLEHPDWGKLGSRIIISNHQKNTKWCFTKAMYNLYNNKDSKDKQCPLISDEIKDLIYYNQDQYNDILKPERDFLIDYFGFKTLEKSYLLRTSDNIIQETPQYLFLRVALGIWGNDIPKVKNTYDMISLKYATHATPTLFNAGTQRPGMLSCFLLGTGDSVEGIYKTITDCARISKWSGGIGVHVSNIRCKGSYIRGTGGKTDGIIPMLKVYNHTARYIDQGGGKRKGSFAIYLEPWHGDIISFLKAMRQHGHEESLARDLFYALWIPDCFMEAVKNDEEWYLMCPDECKGLTECYGDKFTKLYYDYINQGRFKQKIKARKIWEEIIKSQMESGMPYIGYKDQVNAKNNQNNLGVIKSSNLCIEINQFSNDEEYACCNLASICLPNFLKSFDDVFTDKCNMLVYTKDNCKWCDLLKVFINQMDLQKYFYIEFRNADTQETLDLFKNAGVVTFPRVVIDDIEIGGFEDTIKFFRQEIDYEKLQEIVGTLVENLNKIIDKNYYPVQETELSNMKHRPIGIGVQGLADLFAKMWIPYESDEAKQVNRDIFEAIYYFAMKKSVEIAKRVGSYSSFDGSPLSKGQFQFDLWGQNASNNWDWESLRSDVIKFGSRNSLLIALMPTASTSQIMGNTEAFEPFNSCMYVRRTLSGEFIVVNHFLMRILHDLGLWDETMKHRIMFHRGSIQQIPQIPQYIKDMYKTVWEIKKKTLIDMTRDRGKFVCQSQSFNMYFDKISSESLTKTHMYAFKNQLKTGSYYIRSRPAAVAQSFTIDPNLEKQFKDELLQNQVEECEACSA